MVVACTYDLCQSVFGELVVLLSESKHNYSSKVHRYITFVGAWNKTVFALQYLLIKITQLKASILRFSASGQLIMVPCVNGFNE